MRKNKNITKWNWNDADDAPELTREWFKAADLYDGKKLVRRGRPTVEHPKKKVTLRLDDDVISAWRATGKGWQTRLNSLLRSVVEQGIGA